MKVWIARLWEAGTCESEIAGVFVSSAKAWEWLTVNKIGPGPFQYRIKDCTVDEWEVQQ